VLDNLELRELHLHGRRFTWTSSHSAQGEATITKIDRFFYSTSWEVLFPMTHLYAWASTCSDHCPLILQGDTSPRKYKGFRFESYWLKIPGFLNVVNQAWNKPMQAIDDIRRLHIKLSRTAKALKNWEKSRIGNIKLQLAVTKEII
jgi:hypothetical protein